MLKKVLNDDIILMTQKEKFKGSGTMKCPACGNTDTKVTDSRTTDDHLKIRRRRECTKCLGRFTTYEIIEDTPLMVIKKDNSRQVFDRKKLLSGLMRACEKRPIPIKTLEEVIDNIEQDCKNKFLKEISTKKIGELVMQKLKEIDDVAYVRFVSVHHEFSDVSSFMKELENLNKK